MAALKPLLLKPEPKNLLELRLVNCLTNPLVMADMLQFMVDEKVNLRSLYLI